MIILIRNPVPKRHLWGVRSFGSGPPGAAVSKVFVMYSHHTQIFISDHSDPSAETPSTDLSHISD
jgi:hypothetical protein